MPNRINLRSHASIGLAFAFLVNALGPIPLAQAQEFVLPKPGVMVGLSPEFNPPILKGIKVHPENPFRFDFILDQGDSSVIPAKAGIQRLIKYFLASLTIPEKDLWVNLSPYEKDRIVPESFSRTEMGRDLLAEDYMLKQITASLIYPEDETGKKFWKRIYQESLQRFGTTDIPVNTFNKVWIVPEKATVYENAKAGTAYIVGSQLKVMLEQDYLSLAKHDQIIQPSQAKETSQFGSQIVREMVIPALAKEVNYGKNFARLRQIYNSLILAAWYKRKIKDSILAEVYENKKKIAGVNISDPQEKQKIYERYLQAFKKGAYNYIKEEIDPGTQQPIPRKYFSGGMDLDFGMTSFAKPVLNITHDSAQLGETDGLVDISSRLVLPERQVPSASGRQLSRADVYLTPSLFSAEETAVRLAKGQREHGYTKPAVLVLENRPDHLESIRKALGQWFDITGALTIYEAVNKARLRQRRFDLAISDLDLANAVQKLSWITFDGHTVPLRTAGAAFVEWLESNEGADKIILHSTIFSRVRLAPGGFDPLIARLAGYHPRRIKQSMDGLGIPYWGKDKIFKGQLPPLEIAKAVYVDGRQANTAMTTDRAMLNRVELEKFKLTEQPALVPDVATGERFVRLVFKDDLGEVNIASNGKISILIPKKRPRSIPLDPEGRGSDDWKIIGRLNAVYHQIEQLGPSDLAFFWSDAKSKFDHAAKFDFASPEELPIIFHNGRVTFSIPRHVQIKVFIPQGIFIPGDHVGPEQIINAHGEFLTLQRDMDGNPVPIFINEDHQEVVSQQIRNRALIYLLRAVSFDAHLKQMFDSIWAKWQEFYTSYKLTNWLMVLDLYNEIAAQMPNGNIELVINPPGLLKDFMPPFLLRESVRDIEKEVEKLGNGRNTRGVSLFKVFKSKIDLYMKNPLFNPNFNYTLNLYPFKKGIKIEINIINPKDRAMDSRMTLEAARTIIKAHLTVISGNSVVDLMLARVLSNVVNRKNLTQAEQVVLRDYVARIDFMEQEKSKELDMARRTKEELMASAEALKLAIKEREKKGFSYWQNQGQIHELTRKRVNLLYASAKLKRLGLEYSASQTLVDALHVILNSNAAMQAGMRKAIEINHVAYKMQILPSGSRYTISFSPAKDQAMLTRNVNAAMNAQNDQLKELDMLELAFHDFNNYIFVLPHWFADLSKNIPESDAKAYLEKILTDMVDRHDRFRTEINYEIFSLGEFERNGLRAEYLKAEILYDGFGSQIVAVNPIEWLNGLLERGDLKGLLEQKNIEPTQEILNIQQRLEQEPLRPGSAERIRLNRLILERAYQDRVPKSIESKILRHRNLFSQSQEDLNRFMNGMSDLMQKYPSLQRDERYERLSERVQFLLLFLQKVEKGRSLADIISKETANIDEVIRRNIGIKGFTELLNYRKFRADELNMESLRRSLDSNRVVYNLVLKILGIAGGGLGQATDMDFLRALNAILRMRNFYRSIDADRYKPLLSPLIRTLLEKMGRETLSSNDYKALNKALLEAIYPEGIKKTVEFVVYKPDINEGGRAVFVIYKPSPEVGAMSMDALHIGRSIYNLTKNAVEALLKKSGDRLITITTGLEHRAGGRWIEIKVADNGPGIDSRNLGHIFERGFSTKGGMGRGLGLYGVAEVVHAHGGEISVRSTTVRPTGTEFTIRMPIDEAMRSTAITNRNGRNHLGGIDLNTNRLNLLLQNSGQAIKFHIDPAMLRQLQNAPGFTPVIMSIRPADIRVFLGLADDRPLH